MDERELCTMDYGRGLWNYMAEVWQLPALEGIQNTGKQGLLSAIRNLSECNLHGADDPVPVAMLRFAE
jgi:hypothetical protein